jgi:phosphoglycerate kinase
MGLLEPDGRHRRRDGRALAAVPRFKTIDDLPEDLAGSKVLVRVDLNVPMEGAKVMDDTRLRAMLPTVLELSDRGAIVLLLSHFGRPKGEVRPDMSTAQLVLPIHRLTGRSVRFIEDCQGPEAARAVTTMLPGNIGVLENTRFHLGEEKNDPELARGMAALGDYYVNDAFSVSHRAHASTEGITRFLPSYAGRAMEAELKALERALGEPERPVAAVVGGAKVSTKLAVLGHLVSKVEHLIIGGGMANTFLAARGVNVGKSLAEHELTGEANAIFDQAEAAGCTIHLPYDVVVAKEFAPNPPSVRTCNVHEVAADEMILDVGPAAVEALADVLKTCRTLVWNGPLGAFETPPFEAATVALARTAAALTKEGSLVSVAGGGDTVAALNLAGVAQDFTFVSTAGGAFLEWMEGRTLPGVAALEQQQVEA